MCSNLAMSVKPSKNITVLWRQSIKTFMKVIRKSCKIAFLKSYKWQPWWCKIFICSKSNVWWNVSLTLCGLIFFGVFWCFHWNSERKYHLNNLMVQILETAQNRIPVTSIRMLHEVFLKSCASRSWMVCVGINWLKIENVFQVSFPPHTHSHCMELGNNILLLMQVIMGSFGVHRSTSF